MMKLNVGAFKTEVDLDSLQGVNMALSTSMATWTFKGFANTDEVYAFLKKRRAELDPSFDNSGPCLSSEALKVSEIKFRDSVRGSKPTWGGCQVGRAMSGDIDD
jgi:hypothetical protein